MLIDRIIRALKYILLSLVILFALIIAGINLPFSQRLITGKVNKILDEKQIPLHTGRITLLITGKIGIYEVTLLNQEGEAIIKADEVKISARILPLIFRRAVIRSLSVNNASVNIRTDPGTGVPDIVSAFITSDRSGTDRDARTGRKWDVGAEKIDLSVIEFSYADSVRGIKISQSVGKLSALFYGFSISRREISATYLNLADASGSIVLSASPGTNEDIQPHKPEGAHWSFKLNHSVLRNVDYKVTTDSPANRMVYSVGDAEISDARFDMGSSVLKVGQVVLGSPAAELIEAVSKEDSEKMEVKVDAGSFPGKWNIEAESISISDGSFRKGTVTGNRSSSSATDSILLAGSVDADLRDIILCGKEAGFSLKRLSLLMSDGFCISDGKLMVHSDSSGVTRLDGDLSGTGSRLKLSVKAGGSLQTILGSYRTVPFQIDISGSELQVSDIMKLFRYYADNKQAALPENLKIMFNCSMAGQPDSVSVKDFSLRTSTGIKAAFSGILKGLDYPSRAVCSLKFGIEGITPVNLADIMILAGTVAEIPDFGTLSVKGSADSALLAPYFSVSVTNGSGNASAMGRIDINEKKYEVRSAITGIDLGKITGSGNFGKISASADLDGEGFGLSGMSLRSAIRIDTLDFKGYRYTGISADITGNEGLYGIALKSDDEFFKPDIKGEFLYSDSIRKGNLTGSFMIDAGKLNLLSDLTVAGGLSASAEFTGKMKSMRADLSKLTLSDSIATESLRELSAECVLADTLVKATVRSDFLDAEASYNGTANELANVFRGGRTGIMTMLDSAETDRIPFLSALSATEVRASAVYHPVVRLLINDTTFSFNKLSLLLSKNPEGASVVSVSIDRISMSSLEIYNASARLESGKEKSLITIKADSIGSDLLSMKNIETGMTAGNDSARFSASALDMNGTQVYDISGQAFRNDRRIIFHSEDEYWTINGFRWKTTPGEFLVVDPVNRDLIAGIHWKGDNSSVDLSGRLSESLTLDVKNLWLNMIMVPGMSGNDYDGELTGKLNYQGRNEEKNIDLDLQLRKLKVRGNEMGDINLKGSYDSGGAGVMNARLLAELNDTSGITFEMKANKKKNIRSLKSEFEKIELKTIEPFVKDYVSDLSGIISGRIDLASESGKPRMNGSVELDDITLRLIPVNTWYNLSEDKITIDNNRIVFNNFTVLDSLGNRLSVNGSINLNDPGNITSDLRVRSDRIRVMNTTANENPVFNGTIYVNSDFSIRGPLLKPAMEGRIVLASGTVINYTYTEDLSVSESQKMVTFASLSGIAETVAAGKQASILTSRSPDIEASLEIDPNSLFNFRINRGFDIGVSITGGGFLTYSLMPNREIDLNGMYEIRQGSSELKIPGWPRKDFIITPGSIVKWDGKVDDPDLNIETTSRVRGSYFNPVDQKNRDVNFLVYMKLAGRLSEPEIIFDTRCEDQYITSVLNTMSKDERMRQAINLLIFGSIELPNSSSSSDYVTQQINQFWESQINQITSSAFKKSKIDVSLGIDTYTGVAEGGGEQTLTSLSYEVKREMFRDRGSVMVSGRMNDNSPVSQQSNSVIENFIFEYALDTNRTRFLKVYRQQNYEDLLEGEVIKSGIGFIYRKNYDRLRDIWRRDEKTGKQAEPTR